MNLKIKLVKKRRKTKIKMWITIKFVFISSGQCVNNIVKKKYNLYKKPMNTGVTACFIKI